MNFTGISRRIEITFWTLAVRLMKEPKLLRVALISAALIFSLLFGWLISSTVRQVSASRLSEGSATGNSSSDATVLNTKPIFSGEAVNQRKILIVVVDNFQADNPQLATIWLATYVHSRFQLSLIPVFPELVSEDLQMDKSFSEDFELTAKGELSQDFQKLIQSRQISWDNFLFLDEFGLAMLLDEIGGMDLGRGKVSGVRAISQIPLARENAQAALFAYATLARTICRQSEDLVEHAEMLDLYRQLDTHLRTDLPEQSLVDEWQRLRNQKTGVFCEFPSLQKSTSLP